MRIKMYKVKNEYNWRFGCPLLRITIVVLPFKAILKTAIFKRNVLTLNVRIT
jgi:hypothetical protein